MADWLSFRLVLETPPAEGQARHEQLFDHLRDRVNKSLKGTRFVSTYDDVYDVFMRGSNWKKMREPNYVAEPLIEKPAMLLADQVLVKIAAGLNDEAAKTFAKAVTLHRSVGANAANDSPVSVTSLLAEAQKNYDQSMRCLSPLYTDYSPQGVCQVAWYKGGEQRNQDFSEIGLQIEAAMAGKFPKPPRKPFSVKAWMKEKLAKTGFCKPLRPQDTPAHKANVADSVSPPAND